MPPKARFTKQQITDAALQIVRDEGIEHLTSRNLGKKLGSSACPIFTVFASMEEVEAAMMESAKAIYKGYVEAGLAQELPFRGVGEQYIRFAASEPKLFQLLFMSETKEDTPLDSILPLLDESYHIILRSLMASSSIDRQTAEKLYRHLWIYPRHRLPVRDKNLSLFGTGNQRDDVGGVPEPVEKGGDDA